MENWETNFDGPVVFEFVPGVISHSISLSISLSRSISFMIHEVK